MDPYDEPNIKNEDTIIRRINPRQHIVRDDNNGCDRVSTKAFSASTEPNGGMSVDILKLIENAGVNAKEFVITPVFTGSVVFAAGAARKIGLLVGYDPLEGVSGVQDNPHHGEVWRTPPKSRFSSSQRKALLTASEWFVEIPGVRLGHN